MTKIISFKAIFLTDKQLKKYQNTELEFQTKTDGPNPPWFSLFLFPRNFSYASAKSSNVSDINFYWRLSPSLLKAEHYQSSTQRY